jgi:hypothetical protein
MQQDAQRDKQAAANRRTGWILASIALAFLLGLLAKKLLIG